MIYQYVKKCDIKTHDQTPLSEYKYNPDSLIMNIKLKKRRSANAITKLAEIPGTAEVSLIDANPDEGEIELDPYRIGECYLQNRDADGKINAVEFKFLFRSEHKSWHEMTLGIPLTLCDASEKELTAIYDGINFRLVFDGVVVNENLPYGYLCETSGEAYVNSEYVEYAGCSTDRASISYYRESNALDKKFNYYTPLGHNTFIGDIVNFYHDGVYHMIYMPDTHHHGNRWGCGAHHFEHIVTRDFITWEDVGPIWDISEQWHSTGTGTMFFHNGKYYMAYGLHTDRTEPPKKLIDSEQKEYYDKNGESLIISYDEIKKKGKLPIGASYAVSDDGINFRESEIVFNRATNPSVFSDGDKIVMYCGNSIWSTDAVDKPWHIIRENFPPCGDASVMRNTEECPSFFEWNGYKYLIMGVTGFWRTEKGGDIYKDYAAEGFDVYEGLCVPMAVKTDDSMGNRAIIAGWLGGFGWASFAVHRELLQFPDGNLGSRWLPELFPEIKELERHDGGTLDFHAEHGKSYYLDLELANCESGRYSIRFTDANGEGCELALLCEEGQAQYGSVKPGDDSPIPEILPLYKALKLQKLSGYGFGLDYEFNPSRSHDFSIANVSLCKAQCRLRIILYYSSKADATIIDTEIDGKRTLITNRVGLRVDRIKSVSPGTDLKLCGIYEALL